MTDFNELRRKGGPLYGAAPSSPNTVEGHTEAEGYAASLRQQAEWINSSYITKDQLDPDELRAAAAFIERSSAVTAEWRHRALTAEAAVLEAYADHRKQKARLAAIGDPHLFDGLGMAMRREDEPPIPGEPLMSMADAKERLRDALRRLVGSPLTGDERS